MKRILSLICAAGVFGIASLGNAQEKAATSQLPPALRAIGVARGDAVTTREAHEVRGQHMGLFQQRMFRSMGGGVVSVAAPMASGYGMSNSLQVASHPQQHQNSSSMAYGGMFGGGRGMMGFGGNGGWRFGPHGGMFSGPHPFAAHMAAPFSHTFRPY